MAVSLHNYHIHCPKLTTRHQGVRTKDLLIHLIGVAPSGDISTQDKDHYLEWSEELLLD
jgi:hypothetical protein